MKSLRIEKLSSAGGIDTMKVVGFTDEELYRLKAFPHEKAREELLKILDERNNGAGTYYACGYGVYGIWFDNEFAYINVGKSCD